MNDLNWLPLLENSVLCKTQKNNDFSFSRCWVTLHLLTPGVLQSDPSVHKSWYMLKNNIIVLYCNKDDSLGASLTRCLFFRAEVGTIFALSWLITWYGHVLSDFRHVLRLYDFFLASHPLMAIYFAAVVRPQVVCFCMLNHIVDLSA